MSDSMVISNNVIDLFGTDIAFTIPLYQRSYAWEYDQIKQLIDDISDVKEGKKYYLGSLVVFERKDKNIFEVVDGQQRLTTLYLLMKCLGIDTRLTLVFDYRDRSKKTLENIGKIINGEDLDDPDSYDDGLCDGINTLGNLKVQGQLEGLIEKLKNVVIYMIKLPPHTDLNRYFEIMNTRGEQLEQHDIVKAMLMSCFASEPEEAKTFATIWDACSDMTGYVQMHFDTSYREVIFGKNYNGYPHMDWGKLCKVSSGKGSTSEAFTLEECLKKNHGMKPEEGDEEKRIAKKKEYDSIIDFSVFLLHVLHVYNDSKKLVLTLPTELDDKLLIQTFKNVIPKDTEDKKEFSRCFALCLLRTRFLFDTFVIKREYYHAYEIPASSLSLRKFIAYSRKTKGGYTRDAVLTFGKVKNTEICMMQSCLRVSYTTPQSMHWITDVLKFLYGKTDEILQTKEFADDFEEYIEKDIIQDAVKKYWISDDQMYRGTQVLNIVFNYLDYLLWKDAKRTYKEFTFDFRSSVEHFYPQNPKNTSFPKWEEEMLISGKRVREVDQFGNLALVTGSMNSGLSNHDPAYKVTEMARKKSKLSIKLQMMSDDISGYKIGDANKMWKDELCKKHGDKMLARLKKALKP